MGDEVRIGMGKFSFTQYTHSIRVNDLTNVVGS